MSISRNLSKLAASVSSLGALAATVVSDTTNASTGAFQLPQGTTAQRPGTPANGMTRVNTTTNALEVYSSFSAMWITLNQFPLAPTVVNYILLAGGGGGGSLGSGGGAGGALYGTLALAVTTTFTIVLGSGGNGASGTNSPGTNGSNSTFSGAGITTLTAIGGGRGAGDTFTATDGGSGGGAPRGGTACGLGTAGPPRQGYDGGIAGVGAIAQTCPGGGGAASAGGNSSATTGGVGGPGYLWVDGSYYGGGGGGAVQSGYGTAGSGGVGGGGGGATGIGTAGTVNTGGGGGGGGYTSGWNAGGAGGSGVFIIRYPDTYSAAAATTGSPTITVANGYRTYKWTASGSITF